MFYFQNIIFHKNKYSMLIILSFGPTQTHTQTVYVSSTKHQYDYFNYFDKSKHFIDL